MSAERSPLDGVVSETVGSPAVVKDHEAPACAASGPSAERMPAPITAL